MSYLYPDRAWAKRLAAINDLFWLPCPACGEHFGGHEGRRVNGHESGIPTQIDYNDNGTVYGVTSKTVCPNCTASGVGCRAFAEQNLSVHEGCEYVAATTTPPSEVHNGHTRIP